MSEIKRCPFCGITLIADGNKFFVHPVVGCLLDGIPIKNDAESIKRWNTRKPMQNIVERLEEEYHEIDKCKKESYEDGEWERFDMFANLKNGIGRAIVIVKEEGGLHE